MRNKVIRLKDEADGMVAVAVPIGIGVALGGAAVDYQVALRVSVKTADDIQQRSLTAAGMTQNCDKLAFTELKVDTLKCVNGIITDSVILSNAL